MQPGDDPPEPFSVLTDAHRQRRKSNAASRAPSKQRIEIIRANVHRSPMYSGQIASSGPRYCPSIEDKIVKFGERDGHQIFLEPEGLDDHTVYPNGISTSLPEDVQRALVATIPGLENATLHPARLRHRIRSRRSARTQTDTRNKTSARAVSRRSDQRHHRLRRGCGTGTSCRSQRGGARRRRRRNHVRSRASLSRRDDRRSCHARRQRAVSHVHLARRVSSGVARRQCRSTFDRAAASHIGCVGAERAKVLR